MPTSAFFSLRPVLDDDLFPSTGFEARQPWYFLSARHVDTMFVVTEVAVRDGKLELLFA